MVSKIYSDGQHNEEAASASRPRSMDPKIVDRYETSRNGTSEDNPRGNSPHASPQPISKILHSRANWKIKKELATVKPPLYVATEIGQNTPSDNPTSERFGAMGLRQKHLAIITVILHRCVLDGDYTRAGRAWGMLLRAEESGHCMDPRSHDRWGLGAEVLLRRKSQDDEDDLNSGSDKVDMPNPSAGPPIGVGEFMKAKDYYDRLALQYPYRKSCPTAAGPLEFYMAVFSLWIFSVNEWTSVTSTSLGKSDNNISSSDSEASNQSQEPSRADIRRETLQRAQDIAGRLDELLTSPPYSDNARFWRLYGMVALWIGNLLPVALPSSMYTDSGQKGVGLTADIRGSSRSLSGTPPGENNGLANGREQAIARAKGAFERARLCRGNQAW